MKRITSAAALLAATTSLATAGGVDRSGQGIGIIFEQGDYVEFSFGSVSPTVSGSAVATLGGFASGNMSPDYTLFGLGYKQQINDKLSFSLIIDQPFGADVDYPAGTNYFAQGSVAELDTYALTGLIRYKFNENFSAHGGLRYQSFEAQANVPFIVAPAGPTAGIPYSARGAKDYGLGYVAGIAYERSDIALRVALTYSSEIAHSFGTVENGPAGPTSTVTEVETPQSLNLDFQTGIAADTLLFGSIRWVDWSDFDVSPFGYGVATSGGSLVSYENDTITYNLGVGRRFNENWSGAVSLGYEKENGGFSSNLGPTDGNFSIGLGGTYTNGPVKVTGGVRYIKIGNAQTTLGGGVQASEFSDNDAIAVGLKVGYSF